ncbi:MAG: hypothetical protein V1645_04410 [archaeon]
MEEHFPYFISTIASGESVFYCPDCGNLIVWNRGLECVQCRTLFNPPSRPELSFIGQIPSIVGEVDNTGRVIADKSRPFFKKVYDRLRSSGDDHVLRRYICSTEPAGSDSNKFYFTPVVKCFYPSNWPRSAPVIVLEPEYFQVLRIKTEHVFPTTFGGGYKLCIYANWPQVSMRVTLQQRIVPRIIIDLMLADLNCLGKLNVVLDQLGTNLHNVYNIIGKPHSSDRFKREYEKYVRF